ncbi:hypothetical protein [Caproiciproducens galactitolivorans]|uniref:hypothetical protein n=1 Tax=Caproiciproducens galactitolivorans TaxID=642589 RepID=UPI00240A0F9B|nr:hypothetical protein [Caproiciproducens galactitolivorans]
MNKKRKSHFLLCLLIFFIMILPVTAALTCFAENYLALEDVDPSLYLPEKHLFFHRPDGGFVLLSSDGSQKTMAALLDKDGGMDLSCSRPVQNLKYVYEKASPYGDFLYIVGMELNSDSNALIYRLNMKTGERIYNKILGCTFDFTRDFHAEADGKLSLVTAPAGQTIDAGTKASVYRFQETNGMSITSEAPEPEPGPGSASSDAPASSAPSEPAAELPSSIQTYRFEKPVTIEALQSALDANKQGGKVRVLSAEDRTEIKSGPLGTGQIVQTILSGKTETAYIVVIPGDLDGSGTVTDYDYRLLCDYFTQTAAGGSAVLSGPYLEAATLSGGKLPETGDLLKIKRLIKELRN